MEMLRILILLSTFVVGVPSYATGYFIDFDAGDDTNAGTSEGAPWLTMPGTHETADANTILRSSWGSITTSNRIQEGDTFTIKAGTTHTSANGGVVRLESGSGGFYSNGWAEDGLIIAKSTTWGTGDFAIMDGTGMDYGISLFTPQIDGVTLRQLHIKDSEITGVEFKEHSGDSAELTDCKVDQCKFENNGTSFVTDLAGAGSGHLHFRRANGVTVTDCDVIGNNQYINGFLFGESNWAVVDATATDCTADDLRGDLIGNDSGIGFKAQNSRIVFDRCVGTNGGKGFDLGHQGTIDQNISYTVKNCRANGNAWGINGSGPNKTHASLFEYLVFNNLVYDNTDTGMRFYSPPWEGSFVHNAVWNNGGDDAFHSTNINIEGEPGTTFFYDAHVYNNIFFEPLGRQNFYLHYFDQDNDADGLSLDMNYNSWVQEVAELFATWAGGEGAPNQTTYAYGTNGPGKASGNWYDWYSYNTTPPANGATGHFNSDPNSVGTGADDTTEPSFTDFANDDVTLTSPYLGKDISGESWYIAEMGVDRNGEPRTTWDMGAYEFRFDYEGSITLDGTGELLNLRGLGKQIGLN